MKIRKNTNRAIVQYRPEMDDIAYNLALLGLNMDEISSAFGIKRISLWFSKHPSLKEAIIEGGLIADAKVAGALYKRAIGYEYEEEKILASMGEVFRETVTVHVPPDVRAASIWLVNRQRHRWTIQGQIEREQKEKEDAERLVSEQNESSLPGDPNEAARVYTKIISSLGNKNEKNKFKR